jgi:Helitron helicase-like domain at N-terminus
MLRVLYKLVLFVTMTCNLSWKEIKDELLINQKACDRPDIVARGCSMKLAGFKDDIVEHNCFDGCKGDLHTIEFQKRGLPHSHILLLLDPEDTPQETEDYDRFVCTKITDRQSQPMLYDIAIQRLNCYAKRFVQTCPSRYHERIWWRMRSDISWWNRGTLVESWNCFQRCTPALSDDS